MGESTMAIQRKSYFMPSQNDGIWFKKNYCGNAKSGKHTQVNNKYLYYPLNGFRNFPFFHADFSLSLNRCNIILNRQNYSVIIPGGKDGVSHL
jgi:hypothetical protein